MLAVGFATLPCGGADAALGFTLSPNAEVVFDSRTQGCAGDDIPDTGLRAFRRDDGAIIAFDSHWTSRAFRVGQDGSFVRECPIAMTSGEEPDPARFDDRLWIAATWTADGREVLGLGHNEFQGERHPGACAYQTYFQCWYNSIVLLGSNDGGARFEKVAGAVPVANAAFPARAMQGEPRGFFGPTNIIRRGGYFYTIIFTTGGGSQLRGNCLFRSADLGDPAAWQYWTGEAYVPSAYDPYAAKAEPSAPCQPLANVRDRTWSVVFHPGSGLYLATLGLEDNDHVGEVGITTSPDLLHWSPPMVLADKAPIWSRSCGDVHRYSYATLLDLGSSDRNFGDVADHPFLYMTELDVVPTQSAAAQQCGGSAQRRLVRYQLTIDSN